VWVSIRPMEHKGNERPGQHKSAVERVDPTR
jgi:hypothetical protein